MDGKWLKQLLVDHNQTQRALAEYIGIDPIKVNKIIQGKRRLSAFEHMKAREFFHLEPAQLKVEEIKEVVHIPLYDVRAAAGIGAPMGDPTVEKYIPLGKEYIALFTRAPINKLAFIENAGDSMSPTIQDREIVLFDFSVKKYVGPGIYLIVMVDVAHIKRIEYNITDKKFLIKSDNPTYSPMHGDDIYILAKAIMASRPL